MKKILIISLLFLLFSTDNVRANTKYEVVFNKCVDGDTANFILDNEIIKVRFLAIDAPETVHPLKETEYFGLIASKYVCNKIKNANLIEIEYDEMSTKTDKYNRHLAWIWVDKKLLQEELISLGLVKTDYIYGDYIYLDQLYLQEKDAKDKKLGIWSEYIPQTYVVTFDEGGKSKKVTVLENQTVAQYIPKKTGYTFKSWQVDNKNYDFSTLITQDITLYATYEKDFLITDIILGLLILFFLFLTNRKVFKKKLKKII